MTLDDVPRNKQPMGSEAQLAQNAVHDQFWVVLTSNVGRTDLIFVCGQSSLVRLCMQTYKYVCVVVIICATWINIHTHSNK